MTNVILRDQHVARRLHDRLGGHDLVDEYRLMVLPIVLGSGKRLCEGRRPPVDPEAGTLDSGTVIVTHRSAPTTGT